MCVECAAIAVVVLGSVALGTARALHADGAGVRGIRALKEAKRENQGTVLPPLAKARCREDRFKPLGACEPSACSAPKRADPAAARKGRLARLPERRRSDRGRGRRGDRLARP